MTAPLREFLRFSAPDAETHATGIAAARERLQQALASGEPLAIVDHAADLAGLLTTARAEHEALQLLRTHEAAAQALPHEEAAGWFWTAYATALQYTGRRDEAEPVFMKALALCEAAGWQRLQAMTLHHWGRSLAEQHRFDEAEARIAAALALREQLGVPQQASSRQALQALAAWRAGS